MFKLLRLPCLCLCTISLSACMLDDTYNGDFFWDSPSNSKNNSAPLYPEGYDTPTYGQTPANRTPSTKTVVVPQSYHVGMSNAPVASKDEDRQWVDSQNPSGYTIEIAKDAKPAQVANALYKAPKNERSAEVKSQNGTYLGLYGSFPTQEAAEEKLKSLPEDIRQRATVKNWQSVQHDMN